MGDLFFHAVFSVFVELVCVKFTFFCFLLRPLGVLISVLYFNFWYLAEKS